MHKRFKLSVIWEGAMFIQGDVLELVSTLVMGIPRSNIKNTHSAPKMNLGYLT